MDASGSEINKQTKIKMALSIGLTSIHNYIQLSDYKGTRMIFDSPSDQYTRWCVHLGRNL